MNSKQRMARESMTSENDSPQFNHYSHHTIMKNIFVSLFLYGLAIALYGNLIQQYDHENGASSISAASWNYKEKLASYTDRERSHRQFLFNEDSASYR